DDLGIGLPDTCCLDNDKIETRGLIQLDDVLQHRGRGQILAAGRQRAHEDRVAGQAVHANTITEQCTAAAATSGIHRDYSNLQVREGAHQASQQLIGKTRLTRPTGTCYADDRRLVARPGKRAPDLVGSIASVVSALEYRNRASDMTVVACIEGPELIFRS